MTSAHAGLEWENPEWNRNPYLNVSALGLSSSRTKKQMAKLLVGMYKLSKPIQPWLWASLRRSAEACFDMERSACSQAAAFLSRRTCITPSTYVYTSFVSDLVLAKLQSGFLSCVLLSCHRDLTITEIWKFNPGVLWLQYIRCMISMLVGSLVPRPCVSRETAWYRPTVCACVMITRKTLEIFGNIITYVLLYHWKMQDNCHVDEGDDAFLQLLTSFDKSVCYELQSFACLTVKAFWLKLLPE